MGGQILNLNLTNFVLALISQNFFLGLEKVLLKSKACMVKRKGSFAVVIVDEVHRN